MNKDELVRKLAEEFGISTIDIYQIVNTVVDTMTSTLSKEKNVNISEFGKFKTLARKDENGISQKTVSFSPVKKFAHDINFRYNDLNPTVIGLASNAGKGDQLLTLVEENSEGKTIDTKKSFENINPRAMDNKDKYDDNIIRDNLSGDSSQDSMDSLNAFILSKLENPENIEKPENDGIKEFELPHTIIELHNDITQDSENDGNPQTEPQGTIETPEINEQIDIESLIEERKKALEQLTPETDPEKQESDEQESGKFESSINLQAEDRDKLEEFQSFEEERNAELGKIIAERNKIIEDINDIVINAEEIPQAKETVEEKSFENNIVEPIEKPFIEDKPVSEEKPHIEITPLKEDKSYEHKLQYEETNLLQDNFDPIVTSEEMPNIQEEKSDNEKNFISEDIQNFKESKRSGENAPKSFEDVFVTKDETEKQTTHTHSSIPPVSREEIKKESVTPPVMQNVQKQSAPQSESYRQRMRKREQMYTESSKKAKKKGFWITTVITGFLVLIIYLAYNTGSFTPPVDQTNENQQNSEQQNPGQTNEQTPPVANEQGQETKTEETAQDNQQTAGENQAPPTNAPEEVIFDNSLNIAFIKASDGIYIQTASLKNKSDADKMASGVNKGNKEVFVKEADLGEKGKFYRVRIGKFASMEEAKEFAGKLK